jgi:hypothetical protein
MLEEDKTIGNLLELNGERFVIDEKLGLWVKFEVKLLESTSHRPHGIRYSLTLHDRSNNRILGFDNAHAIEHGGKTNVAPRRVYDHWHNHENNPGMPYDFINAGKLLEDFWLEVDKVIKRLGDAL